MAQILVRNLSKKVVERLKKRTKEDGRSFQARPRQFCSRPLLRDMETARNISKEFRYRFKGRMVTANRRLYEGLMNGRFRKYVVWVEDE